MRRLIVLTTMALAACGSQRTPERGVDTSSLADEIPAIGKITGNLNYPSDSIPADIDVCAETLDGKTQHCGAQTSGATYTLEVPVGIYRVYSYLKSVPAERAYYSQFVRCGYNVACPSHEPVTVTVEEGQTVSGIEPGDWYAKAATQDDPIFDNQEDGETTSFTDSEADRASPSPTDPEINATAARARPIGSVTGLFSTDDYPMHAMRNDEEGTTGVQITVGPDGRVWSCNVVASSGSASLDAATCAILQRRARFVPARDGAGNPISDIYTQRISWSLED